MIHLSQLATMERKADPLADRTVSDMLAPGQTLDGALLAQASCCMAEWQRNGLLANWNAPPHAATPHLASALQHYLTEGAALPNWTDSAKVARGERLFMDHGPLACTLLFCTSLPECYVLPYLADVLHISGQLETRTEHRIRQTAAMIFPVMMRGGLTSADGSGVAQVLKVRLIHATIRHLILRGEPDPDAPNVPRGQTPPTPPAPTQFHEAMSAHGWDTQARGLPCNQLELAYTLLTFSYCFLRGMRQLGQPLTNEDEEAYLHTWNVMGHVLGVQTELMAHTMEEAQALFEAIQHQARDHHVAPDPRPPLGQALINTLSQAIKIPVIRHIPVPLTRWLIGSASAEAIGIGARVSWLTRAIFWLGLSATRLIDALVRLWMPRFSLSRLFTRIVGYHLLTRFLLDQTRPLQLPDHLLDAMHATVASWSDDDDAPDWINRLEDRMTTQGDWRVARRPT